MELTPSQPRSSILVPLGTAALVFAAIAPTLWWQEFDGGSENLVVATALEMHREGRWIIPTLQGQDRIAKPPLAAWIAAGAMRRQTLDQIASTDRAVRDSAYRTLGFEARWPALLTACLALIAVWDLGRTLAGARAGALAAAVCASSILFLRYAGIITTDVQLMLWVVLANALLARIILHGRRYGLCIAAGAVLGLAFMSKGPVALVQTVLPAGLFILWRRRANRDRAGADGRAQAESPSAVGAFVAGLVAMVLVAAPWFVWVLVQTPGAVDRWIVEVTRSGATDLPADSVFSYLIFIPLFLPWTGFLVAGAIDLRPRAQTPSAPRDGLLLALLLLVVPIVTMTLFRDRKDRYLLPMVGAAAVLAAHGLRLWIDGQLGPRAARALAWSHWIIVGAMSVGVPLAGWLYLGRDQGQPWLGPALGVGGAVVGALVVLGGIVASRRRPGAMVPVSVVLMLLTFILFVHGYSRSDEARSDMKPLADQIRAQAARPLVWYVRPDGKRKMAPLDLAIYLNATVRSAGGEPAEPHPTQPQVVVCFQRGIEGQPEPRLDPSWRPLPRVGRGKDWLYAFIRPPVVDPCYEPVTRPTSRTD
jgi:4-amino-4-deoxy-L-arabinose transferase-like glycosyltransferase